MTRALLAALVLTVLWAARFGAAPSLAQTERSSTVEQLDLTIDILADGTLAVSQTERTRYDGRFQRDWREIPFQRVSSLTEIHIGAPGQPFHQGYNEPGTFSASRDRQNVRVDWWFAPLAYATQTTRLSYRVSGAIRTTSEADLLRWTVVPAGRSAAIETASVAVRLPRASRPGGLRAQAWQDGRPSPVELIDNREARIEVQSLGPNEALEVELSFPSGIVSAPASSWQWLYDLQAQASDWVEASGRVVTLGLSGLVLALGLWLVLGRPDRTARSDRGPVKLAELTPALGGALVDGQIDGREAAATLLDLLAQGVLAVESTPAGARLQPARDEQRPLGLEPHEQTLLAAACPDGRSASLAALADRWSAYRELFAGQLEVAAAARGLVVADHARLVRRTRSSAALGLVLIAGLGLASQALLGGQLELVWAPFAAGGLVGLAALLTAGQRPKLTRLGRRQLAALGELARSLQAGEAGGLDGSSGADWRRLAYGVALGLDEASLTRLAERPAARLVVTSGAGGSEPTDAAGRRVALVRQALRAFLIVDTASGRR